MPAYLFQIDTTLFPEFIHQIFDHSGVEILTAEESVTIGCQHFELVFAFDFCDFDDRNIKRTSAQIVYRNFAITFLLI